MADFDLNSLPDPGEQAQKYIGMGLAGGANAGKQFYRWAVPQAVQNIITPAIKGTLNKVEPVISHIFNDYLEAPLRGGTKVLTNIYNQKNPFEGAGEAWSKPGSSDWHTFFDSEGGDRFLTGIIGPEYALIPDSVKKIIKNDAGIALNLVGDPINWTGLGGETKLGEAAAKMGMEQSLAKGLQAGERSIAHIGPLHTPQILNKLAGQGLEATGKAIPNIPKVGPLLEKVKEGFQTKTGNVAYDNAKLQKLTNPINLATIEHNDMLKNEGGLIANEATKLGISTEEMNKRIIDYIEPRGSQSFKGQLENPPFMVQREAAKLLTPETKALADKYIGNFEEFAKNENLKGARDYYLEHNATPEFLDYYKKVFPSIEQNAKTQVEGNLRRDAAKSRLSELFKDKTINEINDMGLSGKLAKDFPEIEGFRNKVFDDDVARIHAARYLENAKVLNNRDFMNHTGQTYGISEDGLKGLYATKQAKPGAYVSVKDTNWETKANPEGKLYFPKEISQNLERMKNMGAQSPYAKGLNKIWQDFNTFTKKAYFGLFPASVSKIYLGNNALAYMNDLWSPGSQAGGLKLAKALRDGSFTDKVIVNHPTLGPLTDRQVFDLAKENRGYGMGLFRAEVPQTVEQEEKFLDSRGLQKNVVEKMWQAHNFVEDSTRLGAYVEALKKGYDPFAAGKAVRKALYDYSDLGHIDQSMKKLIPFYTFMRKNVEGMSRQWLKNPGKVALPLKLQNEGSQKFQQERENWDENKAASETIPIGELFNKATGINLMSENSQMPMGLWPATDLNHWTGSGPTLGESAKVQNIATEAGKQLVGSTNPIMRTIGEVLANYNTRSGQPIERIEGERGNFLGMDLPKRAVTYPLSQLRLTNDPARIFQSAQENPGSALVRALTGINVYENNPDLEKLNADKRMLGAFKGRMQAGDKEFPKMFAREALIRHKMGDSNGESVAKHNQALAEYQLKKEAQKLRERFQGGR